MTGRVGTTPDGAFAHPTLLVPSFGQELSMRRCVCFFVAAILLFIIRGASACSWDRSVSVEQLFAQATSVFIGHIVRTEEIEGSIDGERQMIIEGSVRVVEVLKGPPPANGTIRSRVYLSGNCAIPIMAGIDYLLFVYEDNLISYPTGSRALPNLKEDLQDDETKQVLRRLRQLRDKR